MKDQNPADRDTNLGGDHARDTYRAGFGGDHARESHDEPGAGVRGDNYGTDEEKVEDTTPPRP